MKTAIKAIAIILLFAASAHAKGKAQYDVCAIDPSGKLGVYEVVEKQAEALVLARYLERKSGGKRHFFVVVEAIDSKGDA